MKNAHVKQMGHKSDEIDTHASNTECTGREPRSLNLKHYIIFFPFLEKETRKTLVGCVNVDGRCTQTGAAGVQNSAAAEVAFFFSPKLL